METNKIYNAAIAAMGALFLGQIAMTLYQKPDVSYFAVWTGNPKSMIETKNLADQIVTGTVTKVERADDLVIKVPNEPSGEDRIPIEMVTIKVEKVHKGEAAEFIQVFHTGASNDPKLKDRPAPNEAAPKKPRNGIDRPARLPKPTDEEAHTIMLHDDPPYKMGDRHVLFLTNGPAVTVAGSSLKTKRVVSPEGRYRVTPDNKLEPATRRGFAGKKMGVGVQELEAELR